MICSSPETVGAESRPGCSTKESCSAMTKGANKREPATNKCFFVIMKLLSRKYLDELRGFRMLGCGPRRKAENRVLCHVTRITRMHADLLGFHWFVYVF